MAAKFQYKLIVAVNGANLKALEKLKISPKKPITKTTVHRKEPADPTGAQSVKPSVKFARAIGEGMAKADGKLEFITYSFKYGLSRNDIQKSVANGNLKPITDNCQHYSIFAIKE